MLINVINPYDCLAVTPAITKPRAHLQDNSAPTHLFFLAKGVTREKSLHSAPDTARKSPFKGQLTMSLLLKKKSPLFAPLQLKQEFTFHSNYKTTST